MPGFDEWLTRLLAECALHVGEDVDTYVAHAVASRMVADLRHAKNPALGELMTHLSESGVFAVSAMPDVSAAITNPERLRSLYATGLLDSPQEAVYDRITRAAADADQCRPSGPGGVLPVPADAIGLRVARQRAAQREQGPPCQDRRAAEPDRHALRQQRPSP